MQKKKKTPPRSSTPPLANNQLMMKIYEAGLNTNQDYVNNKKMFTLHKVRVPILDMYLFSIVSNYFQFIIEKLTSSTKISAENANKLFCHKYKKN